MKPQKTEEQKARESEQSARLTLGMGLAFAAVGLLMALVQLVRFFTGGSPGEVEMFQILTMLAMAMAFMAWGRLERLEARLRGAGETKPTPAAASVQEA